MKKVTLILALLCSASAFAGTSSYSGKDVKQSVVQNTCPQWYGDNEWNVSLWGAYAFGGGDDNDVNFNFTQSDRTIRDRSFLSDDGWGGGIDVKYFFHRYFGLGIEAFGLSSDSSGNRDTARFLRNAGGIDDGNSSNGVGAVLATFTLRYPIPCARIAPYVYGGIGGIWGGRDGIVADFSTQTFVRENNNDGSLLGQVGGGIEVRFTQHIGLITDVSYNITDNDDFGMIRAGVNFAF